MQEVIYHPEETSTERLSFIMILTVDHVDGESLTLLRNRILSRGRDKRASLAYFTSKSIEVPTMTGLRSSCSLSIQAEHNDSEITFRGNFILNEELPDHVSGKDVTVSERETSFPFEVSMEVGGPRETVFQFEAEKTFHLTVIV